MKTQGILRVTIGFALLAFAAVPLRAQNATYNNLTVSDNFQVSGTADLLNNTLIFGSLSGSSGENALSVTFTDVSGTLPAVLEFSALRTAQQWLWTQQTGSGSTAPMLLLDSTNKLKLYSTSGSTTPTIILDPTAGEITINGQTIGGGSGVWSTSGSNTILSTGMVGIDTTTPEYPLDVHGVIGNSASGATINLNDSNNGITITPGSSKPLTLPDNILSSDSTFWIKSGTAYFPKLVDSSGTVSINPSIRILYDPSGNNLIQYNGSGGGGIGLPFSSSMSGAGSAWPVVFYGTAGDNNMMIWNTTSSHYLYMGYREGAGGMLGTPDGLVRIEESGGAGILFDAGNNIVGGLNTSVNYFGSYGDGYGDDADVAFFTQATYGGGVINERMRIQGGTGYIGINTSSPVALLDVEGNGRFTGPVHLEPQGDLSMGVFTYDPDSGDGGDGDLMGAFGGGGGSGMGSHGGGTIFGGGGGSSLSGTSSSGSSH